jgi:hypothetical protein
LAVNKSLTLFSRLTLHGRTSDLVKVQPGDPSDHLLGFKLDTTRRAFDSLVDFFIEDYMVKKYVAEKSGWRTIAEIAQRSHLSPFALYGKHSTVVQFWMNQFEGD